jgi:hypothetical protein
MVYIKKPGSDRELGNHRFVGPSTYVATVAITQHGGE